ncbi:hypothetical protein CDL12_05017 [Handroanthus impetiginosus]|uniref:C2H2-type domain-containing protein n=1 Tax=Handroanthus impetiginosus TaxID=429701 RepID=A0A2G9HXL1_9LAMI|nr:hypothetical protein CDL12_05017 [Handroanthus impetiginosus]
MKSEKGNDSLDTLIRQANSKEPLLPFSRTGDNPVQWIQLLHALDQPDLPCWPSMTPIKIQMQKCERCSREFCSPINYRRHIRLHRRSLNVNKESHKDRDLLAAYWDKLSLEEAKEVVSFDNVMLKEVPGSAVITALASSLRKPGVWTLPQVYVKAGSALLDIIQAKPSRLPISSQELFSIIDDASERTFLCAGRAESLQKYVFDGEAAKNTLDLKNLVACTSFLFEQQLVKAWVVNKDAEALRCHKLLVEEEEAAQKRQAELLGRKKLKKLRQKEQKVKEQLYQCKVDVIVDVADGPVLAETSGPSSLSHSSSNSVDVPANLDSCLESVQFQTEATEIDIEAQIDLSSRLINQCNSPTNGPQMVDENSHMLQRETQYGFHASENLQKSESIPKIGSSKNRTLLNQSKVWAKKNKMGSDAVSLKPSLQGEISRRIEGNNCEVVIGSISIPLNSCASAQDTCRAEAEPAMFTNHTASKLWRPVNLVETKDISSVERENEDSGGPVVLERVNDRIMSTERCESSQSTDDDEFDNREQYHLHSDGNFPFSSVAAKELLEQRWKEAISGDHVKLVLSSCRGPPRLSDVQDSNSIASNSSDLQERNLRSAQVNFRTKTEKISKIHYIPKQKAAV